MSINNLIYNKPFEFENWVWKIKGTEYFVSKYRQIDCDQELGYYYDFIILVFSNVRGERLFHIRKYNDSNKMSLFCNPYLMLKEGLPELLQRLEEKYTIDEFYYYEVSKGYQQINYVK